MTDLAVDSRALAPAGAGRLHTRFAVLAPYLPWFLAIGYFWPPLNGDVAAILYGAQRMLAGDGLYRALLDPNPPSLFVVSLLPAAAARWLGGGIQLWSVALTLGWAALCLRLAGAILPLPRRLAVGVVGAALFIPADQFGQREHLFVLGLLPYLACAALRLEGRESPRALAVAAGVTAALGTVIKPYFLLVPLALEALLLLRRGRGWGDAERLAFVLGLCAATAGLLATFPVYVSEILPFNLAHYVALDHGGAAAVLLEEGRWPLLLGLALVLPLLRWGSARLAVTAAAYAGAVAIALVQGKGWFYHLVPAWVLLGLGGVLGFAPRGRGWGEALFALGLAGALVVIEPFAAQRLWRDSPAASLTATLRGLPLAERRVLFLTSNIYPQFPALPVAEAVQTMPWLNLWVLDSLYRDGRQAPRTLAEMSRDERRLLQVTAQGFVQGQPILLFAAPVGAAALDPLAWLSRDVAAAAALTRYRRMDLAGLPEGWQAWRRIESD